jgi:hypothetical protein
VKVDKLVAKAFVVAPPIPTPLTIREPESSCLVCSSAEVAYITPRDGASGSSFRLCGTRSVNPTTPKSRTLSPPTFFIARIQISRNTNTTTCSQPVPRSFDYATVPHHRDRACLNTPTLGLLLSGQPPPLRHLHRNGDLEGHNSAFKAYFLLDIHH